MSKGKKKSTMENPELVELKKIEPDPIVIPKEPTFEEDQEQVLSPRAKGFFDREKGEVDEEWIRMNETLYSALDYTESVPFKNDVIKLLYRYYVAYKSKRPFNADALFDRLSDANADPDRSGFRVLMGEKLDQYLLAKKSARK